MDFNDQVDWAEIDANRREMQAESDTEEDHRRFPWLSEDWQDEQAAMRMFEHCEVDAQRAEAEELAAEVICGTTGETEDGRRLGPCQRRPHLDGGHSEVPPASDVVETDRVCPGADLARRFPTTAVNVVLVAHRERGDLLNAWDVLVDAFGRREAERMLRLRDGGVDALTAIESKRRIHDVAEAQDAAYSEYVERAAS